MKSNQPSPLNEIMESLSLKNDDLIKASREQLTHKQVQKARNGKHITANIKGKIVRALNEHLLRVGEDNEKTYFQKDLFDVLLER
ncbi:MAG: hypothetical protein P9M07_04985 [Candidatus Aceula meridiana]|nr:hypothetical protein [Candidatus Aceula meridiana]